MVKFNRELTNWFKGKLVPRECLSSQAKRGGQTRRDQRCTGTVLTNEKCTELKPWNWQC